MIPTPKRLPIWTMGLLLGGMGIFILKDLFSVPVEKVFVVVGTTVFFAGMIASLVGAIWSICMLTQPALRRTYGITTPVVTILIAAFAGSGALLTLYKFKKSHDVRTEAEAKIAAESVWKVKLPSAGRKSSVEPSAKESATPPKSNDEGE
jgi:hypothetical protein